MKPELVGFGVEDRHAEHIGRQQVAGELDARVVQSQRSGDRLRQRRFADAGNVLDQQVAAGKHAGQRELELRRFADDDAAEPAQHGRQAVGQGDGKGLGGANGHGAKRSKKDATIDKLGLLVTNMAVAIHFPHIREEVR